MTPLPLVRLPPSKQQVQLKSTAHNGSPAFVSPVGYGSRHRPVHLTPAEIMIIRIAVLSRCSMQVVTPVAVDPRGRVAHSVSLRTEAREPALSAQPPRQEHQQGQEPCQQACEGCHPQRGQDSCELAKLGFFRLEILTKNAPITPFQHETWHQILGSCFLTKKKPLRECPR